MAELAADQGIVLKTQDHAETDRIAVVLSESRGRLDLLAKGARRLDEAAGAALDVLNVVELVYYQRRSDLHLLREASIIRTFPGIRADLARLESALSLVGWALSLVPKELPEPRAFRLTLSFLIALEGGFPPAIAPLAYGLRLLSLFGYRPHLKGCLGCGSEGELTWSPERGGLLCRACGGRGETLSPRLWRTLEALGRLPLSTLGRLQVRPDELAQMEALLQNFRQAQLGL